MKAARFQDLQKLLFKRVLPAIDAAWLMGWHMIVPSIMTSPLMATVLVVNVVSHYFDLLLGYAFTSSYLAEYFVSLLGKYVGLMFPPFDSIVFFSMCYLLGCFDPKKSARYLGLAAVLLVLRNTAKMIGLSGVCVALSMNLVLYACVVGSLIWPGWRKSRMS